MRPPYSDDDNSDFDDQFADFHEFYDEDADSYHSDAESGYDEPSTTTSIPVSESLQDAMNKCLLERITELVEQIDNFPEFKLINGLRPLQFAASLGRPELVEYFLNLNGSEAVKEELVPSPLSLACSVLYEKIEEDHLKCVELLLEAGADINFQDLYGISALMTACKCSTLEIINFLLSQGASVKDCDNDGWSALFYAVNRGEKTIVQALLKYNPDINVIDKRQRYAYSIACDKGFTDIADLVKPEIITKTEEESLTSANVPQNIPTLSTFMTDINLEYFNEVSEMLSGLATGMGRYPVMFYEKKVNLRRFLLLKNEDELRNIGVPFSLHRKTILNRIKQFHLGCWEARSLGLHKIREEKERKAIDMVNLVHTMATLLQQMHVLAISVEYLQDDAVKFVDSDPELIGTMMNIQNRLKSITRRLEAINKYSKEIRLRDQEDLFSQHVFA